MARAPRKPKAEAADPLALTPELAEQKAAVNRQLRDDDFNGAPPAAFDHDRDGKPGGSKPKTLTEHELTGLFAEAFEAYDMQAERVRFDSKGRRWWFVPEVRNSQSELLLQVTRLDEKREAFISTAFLASDLGRDLVADEVRALDKAMS